MPNFDTSNILDDDKVEITDLDPQNDDSRTSLSIVLLRVARKIPFLANTRTKNTAVWVCSSFPGTAGFDFRSSFRDPGGGPILLSTCTVSFFYRGGFLDKRSDLDQVLQWHRNSTSSAYWDHSLAAL